ncbi:MAG: four helix bundle protein [Bacteroidetes bacterium]|nr:four helix bundle protein [Bacteroidota bacterium]
MPVKNFEDLVCWQKARTLCNAVYDFTESSKFKKDYRLCDQIEAAAVSVMSNIAEGFERARRNEFIQFLQIAKGSCGEVRSQLYVALDRGYITEEQFEATRNQAIEVSRMIGGLRAKLLRDRHNEKA